VPGQFMEQDQSEHARFVNRRPECLYTSYSDVWAWRAREIRAEFVFFWSDSAAMTQARDDDGGVEVDEAALQAHLMSHADALRDYVARRIPLYLRSKMSVDDVLQDVWIDVFGKYASFNPQGPNAHLKWLQTIAKHKLLDAVKAANRVRRGPGRDRRWVDLAGRGRPASFVQLLHVIADGQRTPSSEAATLEATRVFKAALGEMPPDRQRAIWMKYIEERTTEEIAVEMGRTRSAVRSLLARGLRQLRRRMGRPGRYFSDSRSGDGA